METGHARGRGRPRKSATEGERYGVTARLTASAREKLEQAADRNGRSLAQEVEARVEQSFKDDETLAGGDTAMLLRTLGSVVWAIERRTGKRWQDDYLTSVAVNAAVSRALRALSPPPPNDDSAKIAFSDLLDRAQMPEISPQMAEQVKAFEHALESANALGSALAASQIAEGLKGQR